MPFRVFFPADGFLCRSECFSTSVRRRAGGFSRGFSGEACRGAAGEFFRGLLRRFFRGSGEAGRGEKNISENI